MGIKKLLLTLLRHSADDDFNRLIYRADGTIIGPAEIYEATLRTVEVSPVKSVNPPAKLSHQVHLVASGILVVLLLAFSSILLADGGLKRVVAGVLLCGLVLFGSIRIIRGSHKTAKDALRGQLRLGEGVKPCPQFLGYLSEGENIIFQTRRAPISMLHSVAIAGAFSALATHAKRVKKDATKKEGGGLITILTAAVVAIVTSWLIRSSSLIGVVLLAAAAPAVAYRVIRWWVEVFAYTESRLIIRRGLVRKTVDQMPRAQVANVSHVETPLARVLAALRLTRYCYGQLTVASTGEESLEVSYLPAAELVNEQLSSNGRA